MGVLIFSFHGGRVDWGGGTKEGSLYALKGGKGIAV